jgi:hypothetical protein
MTWPQLALGGGYQCVILISNKTAFEWTGAFNLYQGYESAWVGNWSVNGQDFTGENGFTITLPSHGTMKIVIKGTDTVRAGYLTMYGSGYSSSYDVSIAYFYQYLTNGKLTTSTGSTDANSYKTFYFPVEASPSTNTGIAWAPDYSTPETFDMIATLYIPDESRVGQIYASKTIPISGHGGMFVDQMFPELSGTEFHGFLKIEAAYYFCLEVLRMDSAATGFLLTSTPPDWYTP